MMRCFVALSGLALLSACAPGAVTLDGNTTQRALAAVQCTGPNAENCTFINSPVRLVNEPVRLATRRVDFFPTADAMQFIDARSRPWNAPTRTLTDGASIPQIFVPIIGDPNSREFVNAAAMHDAACGIGNENLKEYQAQTWQDTHRMFYDALRVGGTPEVKAKVMFAAVYLGGPRWNNPARDLSAVNRNAMRQVMSEAKRVIEDRNPSVPWIIRYLEWHEYRYLKPVEMDVDDAPVVEDDVCEECFYMEYSEVVNDVPPVVDGATDVNSNLGR